MYIFIYIYITYWIYKSPSSQGLLPPQSLPLHACTGLSKHVHTCARCISVQRAYLCLCRLIRASWVSATHHLVSARIFSYLLVSYFMWSYLLVCYPILFCPVLSCPVLSYRIEPSRILSYPILWYPFLAYHILSYRMLSYRILSYPIVSYRIELFRILPYPILSYPLIAYHIILFPVGEEVSAVCERRASVSATRTLCCKRV